ncbi:GNAT family N-acetyltransferase [Gallaecimonas pentaromativorans]|uniref:Acetyltransferase (GNAT) family protein n=1 Tax=Gallaecimonas pentaromativorans TaxID=584787 RepID=A0A3N1PEZ2_9GAMM|nr:GNAT family N-acetyltransferase [Gallaecimonas pentaromativorans]MED5524262.1 GNAT family N-acetyltransferase [Pseudomonadota bacterium]ROQ30022.1 acetyltransferase (GNAT) family protein [Gallaecimonas pentaromativorans]
MPVLPQFRLAHLDDAAAIADLLVRAWQQSYRQFLPAEFLEKLNAVGRLGLVEGLLRQPLSQTWLVEDDGQLLGFVNTGRSRDPDVSRRTTAELRALYLDPEMIGGGLGSKLLDKALVALREQGFVSLNLWVLENNQAGIKFWLKHGFKEDGCHRIEERDGTELKQLRLHRLLNKAIGKQ